jgi:peptidoglycan/xylan/chitin deacetylase (PgdA/CDA1 family)
LFNDFESLTGWTTATGTSAVDNYRFKTGSAALALTVTSGGSNCSITRTISSDLSSSGTHGFWFYIDDVSKLGTITAYLSSDPTFTKFFSRAITAANFISGWNFMHIARSEWTNTGTDSWSNTMVRFRLRCDAAASQVCTVVFDSYYINLFDRPKLMIHFDDARTSCYTQGYPYMASKGLKGTVFVNGGNLDQATWMTSAQVLEMYNAGWDVGNHTIDHTNLTSLGTQALMQDKIAQQTAWFAARGYTRGVNHFAFPNGATNDTARAAVIASGANTGRILNTAPTSIQSTVAGLWNPYDIKAYSAGNTDTLTTLTDLVDNAIATGATTCIVFHLITASPAQSTEYSIANYQSFIDYVVTKTQLMDVVTVTNWYNNIPNFDPIPAQVIPTKPPNRRIITLTKE